MLFIYDTMATVLIYVGPQASNPQTQEINVGRPTEQLSLPTLCRSLH